MVPIMVPIIVQRMMATFSTVRGKHDKDWHYLASSNRPPEHVDRQHMANIVFDGRDSGLLRKTSCWFCCSDEQL